jgi:hypothetical protein
MGDGIIIDGLELKISLAIELKRILHLFFAAYAPDFITLQSLFKGKI